MMEKDWISIVPKYVPKRMRPASSKYVPRVKRAEEIVTKFSGRPSKYDAERTPDLAHNMALLGLTDVEIAKCLHISEDTLYQWQKDHPGFSEALWSGKIEADGKVVRAFHKRALGFSVVADKVLKMKDEDGADYVLHEPYVEYYPPDVSAAKSWLFNRQRGKWYDKPDDAPPQNPLINLTFNVVDPVEAASVYQKLIQQG